MKPRSWSCSWKRFTLTGIDQAWRQRSGVGSNPQRWLNAGPIQLDSEVLDEDDDDEVETYDDLPPDQFNPLLAKTESALLVSDEPISPKKLAKWAELPDAGEARRQVGRLNAFYKHNKSAFWVHEVAGGYLFLTDPSLDQWLDKITDSAGRLPLSGPVLETLSIVAYRQPINRADVEAIRGVQIGEILKQLVDDQLIRVVGKDDTLGRPNLYGTTRYFLQYFGLRHLNELPRAELLRNALPEDQKNELLDDFDDDEPADEEAPATETPTNDDDTDQDDSDVRQAG